MADVAGAVRPLPRRLRLPASGVILVTLAALAWAATIALATRRDMSAMPGTMGLGLGEFVATWALMMAAMMLPSVWPFVAVYERTIRLRRVARLGALAGGYLLAWALVGVAAFGVAWVFGELAADHHGLARVVAVAAFAALGVYQLTPLKFRCLSHCRSPLAHLLHYTSFRGPLRDLRAGIEHGLYCLGCCWALMLVLLAFGVMNLAAMIGVAVDHRRGEGVALRRDLRPGGRRERPRLRRSWSASSRRWLRPRSRRCHERRHGDGRDGGEGPGAGGGDSLISRCQRFGEVALDGGAVEVAETASWAWNRRRRRLLVTTKTLDSAIAAPASIGLSSPAAASGRAATL